MDQIEKLYVSCINCSNTDCRGINKNKAKGIIPKGFFYSTTKPKILIAAKNPGHPLEGEIEKYKGKSDFDMFVAHKQFVKKVFTDPKIKTTFHKNLEEYIKFFLGFNKDAPIDIFDYVNYTNLVKCETINETGRISTITMENCFRNYFLQEIELFKPKVILALGREVELFLKKKNLNIPIIYIKHPSYYELCLYLFLFIKNIGFKIMQSSYIISVFCGSF